jgi:trk system potassium uptake protein TrkA
MKVLIAGAGKVGTFIAGQLAGNGHEITLVDVNPSRVEQIRGQASLAAVRVLNADACEVTDMMTAGAEQTDVVVAVTGDDEDNLVISMLAKQEFAVPRVMARINHPENEWLFDRAWGVDVAVSTPHLLTGLVEEAVTVGQLVRLMSLPGGKAHIVEVTLAEGTPVAGRDLASLAFPRNSTVVAVIRGGNVIVPRGDTVLLVGDEVLVLASDEAQAPVRQLLVG